MSQKAELAGQIALVTGGSRGIGFAIARSLAEAGAVVAVVARDGDQATKAASRLPGSGHAGFSCNVALPAQVVETVTAVKSSIGAVEILVNNAGITRDNILLRIKDDDWDEVIDVNLKGAFNFIKAVTRSMIRRHEGVILNITSVVGLMGAAGQVNYAASKAGLLGLTKSVARELASRNVRCNAIAPGYVATDLTAELSEAQTERIRGAIPLGRLGEPDDIAGVARFLVGPSARYITGQILAVDGGMVM